MIGIGEKLFKLEYTDGNFIVREYEVVKVTKASMWLSPRNIPNKRAMEYKEKFKRNDARFKPSKDAVVKSAIAKQLIAIRHAKDEIRLATASVEKLKNL